MTLPLPDLVMATQQRTIPSYVYQQYADDDALQTFVQAFNILTQGWVDAFNALNLPLYCSLYGDLLDWVGKGLYGIPRPVLSSSEGTGTTGGPYASAEYAKLAYAEGLSLGGAPSHFLSVTDDVYKRILTWHHYKGDGKQFSFRWLKRRVHRFLNGRDGVLMVNDTTADVSVTAIGSDVTITVANTSIGQILQYSLYDGVLALPFQFTFTVDLV